MTDLLTPRTSMKDAMVGFGIGGVASLIALSILAGGAEGLADVAYPAFIVGGGLTVAGIELKNRLFK